jgi:hypothetical protein
MQKLRGRNRLRPCNIKPKHDGVTRAGLDAQDERAAIYARDGGRCQTCGERVAFDAFELAHRIANTKANRRRWGSAVIDSPLNKAVAHRGRCNSAQNIGGRPVECAAMAARILATCSPRSTS